MHKLFRSIELDFQFLLLPLPFSEKISLILKKYFLFIRDTLSPVTLGKTKTTVFGKPYFYDDKFALGVLQGTFVDNAFLKNFIPPRATIIDIGANIGQFSLFCYHFLHAKRVYSFEPVPDTFSLLQLNEPKYGYNIAISTKKKLSFYLSALSVWASMYPSKERNKAVHVTGGSLDTQTDITKLKKIDLLKIDTEGSELDVLKVSKKTLRRSHFILIETTVIRDSESTFFDVLSAVSTALPGVRLIHIGRAYNDYANKFTGAVDLLFENELIA